MRAKKFFLLGAIRLFLLLFILFISSSLMNCAGTALPQSSIPIPQAVDTITVSSPDGQGNVYITGATGSLPANTSTIVQVGDNVSYFKNNPIYNLLVPNAVAQAVCVSDLPECPNLDENSACHIVSKTDGAITAITPAQIGDTITISFLDPDNSCLETQAFVGVVKEGIVPISMDVVSSTFDQEKSITYFLGTGLAGILAVQSYNSNMDTLFSYDFSFLTGSPQKIVFFKDHNNKGYLVIETSEHMYLGPIETDGTLESGKFIQVVNDIGDSIQNLKFLTAQHTVKIERVDDCVDDSLFEDLTNKTFTRLFFFANNNLYILEFEGGLDDANPSAIRDDKNLTLREVPIDILSIPDVGSIFSIPFFAFFDPYLALVVDAEMANEETNLAVRLTNFVQFCSEILTFSVSEPLFQAEALPEEFIVESINLGPTEGDIYIDLFRDFDLSDGSEEGFSITFLKRQLQFATNIELTTESFVCDQNDTIDLSGEGKPDAGNQCEETQPNEPFIFDFGGLLIENVDFTKTIFDQERQPEMFLLGDNNGGSHFIKQLGLPLAFETEEFINAIHPISLHLDPANDQINAVDAGLDGDVHSNYILLDLAETPL